VEGTYVPRSSVIPIYKWGCEVMTCDIELPRVSKDNKYDICKTFKEWLAKNEHRFNHKFKIHHYKTRGFLNIYFDNVTPEIRCSVNERLGVAVAVHYRRKCWDLLCDFDCAIRMDNITASYARNRCFTKRPRNY
jgi:hypothetical protein